MPGTSETDAGDPLVAPPNADLRRNLTDGEHLRLNVHQHPAVLWKPVAILAAALTVLVIVLTGDRLPLLVLILLLGAVVNLAWRVYERSHNSFAATDRRVMRVEGVLNKSFPMMRLQKITDMRLDQPLLGRLLGYGTIVIESAGQDQAIRELRYAPQPTQVYRRLNAVIFDATDDDDEGSRHPPLRRAATRTADLARRTMGRTRRQENHAAGSAVGDNVSPRFFGAGERPDDTGEIPVRRPK